MIFAFAILAAAGCVNETQVQAEFDAHVAENNECAVDADCTVISPGCPIGCFAAVRADAADACQRRANSLIDQWEAGGRSCAYSCIAVGAAYCSEGRCTFDPI